MNKITINNILGLLEECLINGDKDMSALYAWFSKERKLIEEVVEYGNSVLGKYTVDCFTEESANTKFPENTYQCYTTEEVAKIIRNCTRKISGIKKIEVWINRHDG